MSKTAADWIQHLTSDDKALRSQAVRALGYMGSAAIDPLVVALQQDTVPPKILAEVFGLIGQNGLDRLADLLQQPDSALQIRSAGVLALIADARSIIPLVMALKANDEQVREVVAQSLASFSDPRASSPLIDALGDSSARVRAAAASSLANYYRDARVESALIQVSADPEAIVRIGAARGLAAIQTEDARARLDALTHDSSPDVRQMAAAALRFQNGDRMVFERLKGDVSETVDKALEQMLADSELNDDDLDVMRHSNPRVRAALLSKVGDTIGENAVKILLPGLNDINPAVRGAAVDSLARMGRAAVPHLLLALRNPSKYIRAGSLQALAIIADPSMIESVSVMLKDPEAMVRLEAARALTAVRSDAQAVKALNTIVKDPDPEVRAAALQALGQTEPQQGGMFSRLMRKLRGD